MRRVWVSFYCPPPLREGLIAAHGCLCLLALGFVDSCILPLAVHVVAVHASCGCVGVRVGVWVGLSVYAKYGLAVVEAAHTTQHLHFHLA